MMHIYFFKAVAPMLICSIEQMIMARIFTIDLDFQHQQFTALVTACTRVDGMTRFTVLPNDEVLKQLLPEGKLSFNSLSDLSPLVESQPNLHELVLSLTTALQQKLQLAPG